MNWINVEVELPILREKAGHFGKWSERNWVWVEDPERNYMAKDDNTVVAIWGYDEDPKDLYWIDKNGEMIEGVTHWIKIEPPEPKK